MGRQWYLLTLPVSEQCSLSDVFCHSFSSCGHWLTLWEVSIANTFVQMEKMKITHKINAAHCSPQIQLLVIKNSLSVSKFILVFSFSKKTNKSGSVHFSLWERNNPLFERTRIPLVRCTKFVKHWLRVSREHF